MPDVLSAERLHERLRLAIYDPGQITRRGRDESREAWLLRCVRLVVDEHLREESS